VISWTSATMFKIQLD